MERAVQVPFSFRLSALLGVSVLRTTAGSVEIGSRAASRPRRRRPNRCWITPALVALLRLWLGRRSRWFGTTNRHGFGPRYQIELALPEQCSQAGDAALPLTAATLEAEPLLGHQVLTLIP